MTHPRRSRRPASRRTRGVVAFAALLPLAALLAGCGDDPPEIHAPEMSAADAAACRDFVADLPDTLAGQDSVEVTGDTEYGAAWGDPAIVLTCGVDDPPGFEDTSTCIAVRKTGWFVPDEVFQDMFDGDDKTDVPMTEMNYSPRIHVDLPGEYRPDGFTNTAGELAVIIERELTRSGKCL